jgi:hypothetical protein
MAYTIQVGALRCHILSDGLHYVDGGGFFGLIPRTMWQEVVEPTPLNQVPCDTRSLLIESDAGLILVDVAMATSCRRRCASGWAWMTAICGWWASWRAPATNPKTLTSYCSRTFTATTSAAPHAGKATCSHRPFPRARYIGQRIDLADASYPNERTTATYVADNFQPLLDRKLLEIVDGPQRLASGVRTDIAPGHTQALQVVWVESQGERCSS